MSMASVPGTHTLSVLRQAPAALLGSVQKKAASTVSATITTMTSFSLFTISSVASFSLPQVVLQVTDSWLEVLGNTLMVVGVTEENMLRRKVVKMHWLARTIRMMGKEKERREVEKKLGNISVFGLALMVVIAAGFVKQMLVLMTMNVVTALNNIKDWIIVNKVEMILTILVMTNVTLLVS